MCQVPVELEASLSRLVAGLEPSFLHGNDAKALVGFFSRLEHLAAAGKALCALRVSETGVFELDGHRHAGEWLAAETGDSLGGALSVLEAAEKVAKLPELEEALRSGELSAAQVKEVAGAAVVDPGATSSLLDTARTEDFEGLRRRCAQVKAAKASEEDEAQRSRRLHAARRLRTWTEADGTFRLDARLTPDAGAKVLASLKDEADKIFSDARRAGVREPSGAYLADALLNLVTRGGDGALVHPKALAHLRVDLTALRRGNTGPGELCEIEGVGPVSVSTARQLLGESIAKLLVTSATDVHAVCHLGRAVPASVHSALLERDKCCVVPGCSATHRLEIDHRVIPFADGGPTSLDNLARICHHHHFLKTHDGFSLEGEPGNWIWVHPDGTREGPGAKAPLGDLPSQSEDSGSRAVAPRRPDQPPPPEQSSLFATAEADAGSDPGRTA